MDDPANDLPNWIVLKSREQLADVESFEKEIGSLHDALIGAAADLYFSDAPEDVLKARGDLVAHLAADVEEDAPVVKSTRERVAELLKAGAYDEPGPESEQTPTGLLNEGAEAESAAVRVEKLPGDPEGGEPAGAAIPRAAASDTEPKAGVSEDKYGREVDDKTGELIESDADAEAAAEEASGDPADGKAETPEDVKAAEKKAAKEKRAADKAEADKAAAEKAETEPETEAEVEKKKRTAKEIKDAEEAAESAAEENLEKMAKSIGAVMEKEFTPIREAVLALADRIENVEKASATSQAIELDALDPDVPDDAGATGIAKSLRTALRTGKVTLS